MPGEFISLRAAADRLGLHYMTVYRYVRTGRLPATNEGGRWFVRPADVDALTTPSKPPADRSVRSGAAEQLEDRLLAADEAGAWSVVSHALTSGAEPAEIHLGMLIPALQSIGQRWHDGTIDVFEEHQATVVAARLTARLGPRFHRRGTSRGHVVVGLVSGDTHALTTAIIADLIRGRGFDVTDLGANTPTESFLEVLDAAPTDEPLPLTAISATTAPSVRQATDTIAEIRSRHPDAVIALGGNGVRNRVEAEAAGATIWSHDVEGLLDQFDQLTRST